MLHRLNKFAPFLVLALVGYLTYSALEDERAKMAEAKEPPLIPKNVLNVKLAPAVAHASPADRDPFDVGWLGHHAAQTSTRAATAPASQPTTRSATSAPVVVEVPPLPGGLAAVFMGEELRLAVIGEKIYKPGAFVDGNDPSRCWQVERVEQDHVVLRFENETRTLRLQTHRTATSIPSGRAQEPRR